jgi:large subunit ribosomal protein L29
MAKVKEIRELPDEELISQLESDKEELFNLRFQYATGQLDNPHRIKQVRHNIARTLTVLRERHLESEVEEEVFLADEKAIAEAREELVEGKVKGQKLSDMVATSAPIKEAPLGEQMWDDLEVPPE